MDTTREARKKKRYSKPVVRAMAWGAGAVAFAVPWAAFQVVHSPATGAQGAAPQVIVVPAGSKVILLSSPSGTSVKVIRSNGTTTSPTHATAPLTTTRASAPPP